MSPYVPIIHLQQFSAFCQNYFIFLPHAIVTPNKLKKVLIMIFFNREMFGMYSTANHGINYLLAGLVAEKIRIFIPVNKQDLNKILSLSNFVCERTRRTGPGYLNLF